MPAAWWSPDSSASGSAPNMRRGFFTPSPVGWFLSSRFCASSPYTAPFALSRRGGRSGPHEAVCAGGIVARAPDWRTPDATAPLVGCGGTDPEEPRQLPERGGPVAGARRGAPRSGHLECSKTERLPHAPRPRLLGAE